MIRRAPPHGVEPLVLGPTDADRLTAELLVKVWAKRAHQAGDVSEETSAVQFRPPQFGSRDRFAKCGPGREKLQSDAARECRMLAILGG